MANKMTKKDYFNKLKDLASNDPELIAFLDNEIALVVKKNGAKKSPTKNQIENATFKTDIINALNDNTNYTVSEIMDLIPSLTNLTNQRVSAILTQLVKENELIRTEIKRKAYFSKA